MTDLSSHLIIGPILLPMVVAAASLLVDERRRALKSIVSLATLTAVFAMAIALLHDVATGGPGGEDIARVYRLGDWVAPYGIVLVADRLSALMLALTALLAGCALMFATARWDRAGPRFHALFLLLVMGVNGAILTGDLFNLFVFFEIMLAASYGMVLHGSGDARIRAGLTYIAVNLTASLLFLVGVALIYGVTGTLNMADLAMRIPAIAAADRGLFHIGCAVLGLAFLIKCAMWPVGFWLVPAYAAASAPVAAVFAILSKVGVYVVVRLSFLLFSPLALFSADLVQPWLLVGGVATVAFGTAGILAARRMARAAGYAVIVSSGTVLAVAGSDSVGAMGGALYYLVGSTLACGALFLVAEVLDRDRSPTAGPAEAVFDDEYRDPFDDQERNEPGFVIPAAVAALGGATLMATLMVAGLPPLAGFVGKLAMIDAMIGVGDGRAALLVALLSVSSLGTLIGLSRLGVGAIWIRPEGAAAPVVGAAELAAIAGLLGACVLLTIFGGQALAYADLTAGWLAEPQGYVSAVLEDGSR